MHRAPHQVRVLAMNRVMVTRLAARAGLPHSGSWSQYMSKIGRSSLPMNPVCTTEARRNKTDRLYLCASVSQW